ncbi:MAG: M48 family metalloprotease [Planctomycetaceae bacterium]
MTAVTDCHDGEFAARVSQIEQRFAGRPTALRRQVGWLVVLGLSVIIAVLGLTALLAAFFFVAALHNPFPQNLACLAVASVLLSLAIGQSICLLWVPTTPPSDRELKRDECPRLFQVLDSLQSKAKSGPFDHVWLNSDDNAQVWVEPRLGFLGFGRRHLLLGFPLLLLVTPAQATAILAHELAHQSASHDWFSLWISRVLETWSSVFSAWGTSTGSWWQLFRKPLLWFVAWYWPRFHAHAFVLSRTDEYEADRRSAEWTTVEDAATALFAVQCLAARLSQEFWPHVDRHINSDPTPPEGIYPLQYQFMSQPADPDLAACWISEALRFRTLPTDSHPSLADRLSHLGMSPETLSHRGFPLAPDTSAAHEFLAPRFAQLCDEMSRGWKSKNARAWNIRFHHAQRLQRELAASPVPGAPAPGMSPEGKISAPVAASEAMETEWNRLCKEAELQGFRRIEPMLRDFLDRYPHHLPGWLTLGRNLLLLGDDAGQACLRRVVEGDQPALAADAFLLWKSWLERRNDPAALDRLKAEFDRFQQEQQAAAQERRSVRPTDRFRPVILDHDQRLELQQLLTAHPELEAAWLAEKELQHQPHRRLFVLVVSAKRAGFFDRNCHERNASLARQISTRLVLPGQWLVIPPDGGFHKLARVIRNIPQSRLEWERLKTN